jgi:hypothetical protein
MYNCLRPVAQPVADELRNVCSKVSTPHLFEEHLMVLSSPPNGDAFLAKHFA